MKHLMITAFALALGTAAFAQTESSTNAKTPIEKKETPKQEQNTAQPTTEQRKAQEAQQAQPATPATPAAPKPADPAAPAKASGPNED